MSTFVIRTNVDDKTMHVLLKQLFASIQELKPDAILAGVQMDRGSEGEAIVNKIAEVSDEHIPDTM